jgi:hypothetical protein
MLITEAESLFTANITLNRVVYLKLFIKTGISISSKDQCDEPSPRTAGRPFSAQAYGIHEGDNDGGKGSKYNDSLNIGCTQRSHIAVDACGKEEGI